MEPSAASANRTHSGCTVRGIGADTVTVTPRWARGADCQVTQILLPTALTVRCAAIDGGGELLVPADTAADHARARVEPPRRRRTGLPRSVRRHHRPGGRRSGPSPTADFWHPRVPGGAEIGVPPGPAMPGGVSHCADPGPPTHARASSLITVPVGVDRVLRPRPTSGPSSSMKTGIVGVVREVRNGRRSTDGGPVQRAQVDDDLLRRD